MSLCKLNCRLGEPAGLFSSLQYSFKWYLSSHASHCDHQGIYICQWIKRASVACVSQYGEAFSHYSLSFPQISMSYLWEFPHRIIRSAYHPLVIVCGKSKNLCFHILFIFFNFNHVNPTIGFPPYCHFSDCPTYHRWSSFTVFPMPGHVAWEKHLCIQVLMYSLTNVLWATPWILPFFFLFCFYYYCFFYMCKLRKHVSIFLIPTETPKIYVENAVSLFMSAEKWEEMRLVRGETDMQQRSGLESNWGYCSLWLVS